MTLDETRQLGIEFERRIQTMIPETQSESKLDTETIYSYLNQFQDKFVHEIYKSLDSIPSPSKPSAYIETLLSGLVQEYSAEVIPSSTGVATLYSYPVPSDFGLYIDSSTKVDRSYEYKVEDDKLHNGVLQNKLVAVTDLQASFNRPQDTMRILREPVACLNTLGDGSRVINVIYDRYTVPVQFNLTYYKVPKYMDLFTSSPCELPMDAFEDLVSGAVDLYVQYVAGAEARKRQMAEQQQRQNRRSNENE